MEPPQLRDIAELKEVDSTESANKYLGLGWVLLSTHLVDYGHPTARHQKTIYCLGWPKHLGEPAREVVGDEFTTGLRY